MPYIKQEDRARLMSQGGRAESPGDLAYLIYCLVVDWAYREGNQLSYSKAATAIGVLETIKDEFRRRHLDPYEDGKREDNGDVSTHEAHDVIDVLVSAYDDPRDSGQAD